MTTTVLYLQWQPAHVILFGRVGESDRAGLENNQLTSFSSEGLGNLTKLYLQNNQLTSFSSEGLGNLTKLDLSSNQLTSFSSEGLGNLTKLFAEQPAHVILFGRVGESDHC